LKLKSLTAILIMLAIYQSLLLSALPSPVNVKVEVFPDGWSYVEARYEVPEPGKVLQISIPVSHYENLMVVDDQNLLLNFSVSEGQVYVQTNPSTKYIIVMYQTPSLTHKDGIMWNLTIRYSASTVKIVLPKGAVVVGMSSSPSSLNTVNGVTTLTFGGASWITYVLPPPVNSTKANTRRSSSQVGNQQEGAAQPAGGQTHPSGAATSIHPLTAGNVFTLAIVAVVAIVVVAVVLLSRRSSSRKGERTPLTEEEEAILDEIRRRGGRAYQSEIVRSLDLPKTTVWRRLRRLESKGYIDIIKTDKGNLAVLRRSE